MPDENILHNTKETFSLTADWTSYNHQCTYKMCKWRDGQISNNLYSKCLLH